MSKPFVAANWKMHTTPDEAADLVRAMKDDLASLQGIQVVLCPPFVSLPLLADLLKGSPVAVGAQNAHWEEQGAFTGEIAPRMLQGLCRYVIIGHSERRHIFGETDDMVRKKVAAVLAAGLTPILCVGEVLDEREQGRAADVVTTQLRAALEGVPSLERTVVAYEPVWAIGTGRAADGPIAEEMMSLIRRLLAEGYGDPQAQQVPLLYGGSVNPGNIPQFVGQPNIDGALVGGASLKPDQFVAIARTIAEVRAEEAQYEG